MLMLTLLTRYYAQPYDFVRDARYAMPCQLLSLLFRHYFAAITLRCRHTLIFFSRCLRYATCRRYMLPCRCHV